MKKPITTAIACTFAVLASSSVQAQDKDMEGKIDLETLDCRTMLKMENEARDFTLIFFHGLMSGKKSEMIFDGPALTEVTEKVLDHCIDNPSDTLLTTFEELRS